ALLAHARGGEALFPRFLPAFLATLFAALDPHLGPALLTTLLTTIFAPLAALLARLRAPVVAPFLACAALGKGPTRGRLTPALARGLAPALTAASLLASRRRLGRHALERVARRRLLGLLLVAPASVAQGAASDHDLDRELLQVVGTGLVADAVDGMGVESALHVLLEQALIVGVALVGGDVAGL